MVGLLDFFPGAGSPPCRDTPGGPDIDMSMGMTLRSDRDVVVAIDILKVGPNVGEGLPFGSSFFQVDGRFQVFGIGF